jgi:hypothetical protein
MNEFSEFNQWVKVGLYIEVHMLINNKRKKESLGQRSHFLISMKLGGVLLH